MRKVSVLGLVLFVLSSFNGFAQSGGQGFPRVLGKWTYLNQTDTIPSVALYTPQTGGIFRVTFVEETTGANAKQNSYWDGGVSWTNEVGQNNPTGVLLYTQSKYSTGSTVVMRVAKGTPILFSTSSWGDVSSSRYNLYIVLEELSPL